jgi:ferritin-like metal-binding protein YciE
MSRDVKEAVNSYITDMLALEDDFEKALGAQVRDYENERPEVIAQLGRIHSLCEHHIRNLNDLTERRGVGKGLAETVKRAGSTLAGIAGAAINVIRSEKLPKSLRDDFTAMNLASIGYTMLYTTARSLDEPTVAEVALRHLRDYSEAVLVLHNLIPSAVVNFLQEDGLPANQEVLPEVYRTLDEVWRNVNAVASGTAQHPGFNR